MIEFALATAGVSNNRRAFQKEFTSYDHGL